VGYLRILQALAADLHERGGLDLSECFIDGTFILAKKGGNEIGETKRGKGTKKLMAITIDASLVIVSLIMMITSTHGLS
jgi:hypothetical protein